MRTTHLLTGEAKFLHDLGVRMRDARKRSTLTVRDVETQLGEGFSRSSISLWEHGKVPIDVVKLYRLARLYGTTAPALLSEPLDAAELLQMLFQAMPGSALEKQRSVGP